MSERGRGRPRRLITKLKDINQYRKRKSKAKNPIPLCPYCSDKEEKIAIKTYNLYREVGSEKFPRYTVELKRCSGCGRVWEPNEKVMIVWG